MRLNGSDLAIRAFAVVAMTVAIFLLSALLLPPKGSNAMPQDHEQAPMASPR